MVRPTALLHPPTPDTPGPEPAAPRPAWLNGATVWVTPAEPAYGELVLTCPQGQLAHRLDWQTQHPVRLLRHVQRLTAPNPGVMTGPGTNSYVVGDASTGYLVIDPGPNDIDHLKRLARLTGSDIRAIVCTHSHPDHSPGAQPLQQLCTDAGQPAPPIWGLPSAPTARAHSTFTPDAVLADDATLIVQGPDGLTHTLRAVHTPGHAANHVCLILEEDGLLFSGDHVLNGSTTVIDPPDGHMDDYLRSLDRLTQRMAQWGVAFILPAHGYVLGDAPAAIERLRQHRLAREARVLAAMRRLPQGGPDDWVPLAYDDVPARLWPVAKRSLIAHVQRIEALGLLAQP